MFLRTKTAPSGKIQVQIVRSVRIGQAVRQRVVRHVGSATSEEQLRQLRLLGQTMIEEMRQADSPQQSLFTPRQSAALTLQAREAASAPTPLEVNLAECRESSRTSVGIREAFGEIYRQLGWDQLLGARRMAANRIVKELVLARLAQPQSKRATVQTLTAEGDVFLNLDQVYKTLDTLDEPMVAKIQAQSLAAAQQLYQEPIQVVFVDTTTLSFASEVTDPLREQGYSKDGKHHRVQVLLALLINPDGIPVGYEVFPGNRYEGHTLIPAIPAIPAMTALRDRHPGVRFTLVADAGLINARHEAALQAEGIPYILGARLKSQSQAFQQRGLDPAGYADWNQTAVSSIDRYQCLEQGEAVWVVTGSAKRARKDAHERAKRIEKLQKKLAQGSQTASVSRNSDARFLDFPAGRVTINPAKVAEAARWDGLRAIKVWGQDPATDPRQWVQEYRRLWTIEACFRTNKHDLKIRPVFHWKPGRVKAHLAMCTLAFCCLQHLRHRLSVMGTPMSPAAIQRTLNQLQFSLLVHPNSGRQFALPSPSTAESRRIYRVLGLPWNEAPFAVSPRSRKKRKSRRRRQD